MSNPFRKITAETLVSFSILAALTIFMMGGISFPLINNVFAQVSTSTSQTINLTVNQTITLSLSTSTISLGSLTPGVAVSASSSATVATNSANGWNLKVNRNSATSTLASSTSITFPDATAWNGSNGTTSPGATLAFKVANTGTDAGLYSSTNWGATDVDGVAKYAGFPTAATTVASTNTYAGTNQIIVLRVRADAPATQQATNYTGTITITAITNP